MNQYTNCHLHVKPSGLIANLNLFPTLYYGRGAYVELSNNLAQSGGLPVAHAVTCILKYGNDNTLAAAPPDSTP